MPAYTSWILKPASVGAPRRGPSLATQAYQRLKMQFMLGEMQPGRHLTYRDVAEQLGISVTPAREALFKLVAERIFDTEQNGTIVVPKLSTADCRELWRIRILLETDAAEIATKYASPELIAKLEQAHGQMAQAKQTKRLRDAMRHNLAFHFILYQEARSPILLSLIEDVWARSAGYVQFFHSRHVEQRSDGSAQGPHMHSTIITGLRAGDAERVKNGITRDLLEVRDGILGMLDGIEIARHPAALALKKDNSANAMSAPGAKRRRVLRARL